MEPKGKKAGGKKSSALHATIWSDGAARGNPGNAGVGWIIESGGETLLEGGRFIGTATNNVAEYEGALDGLQKALDLGVSTVDLKMDSELVVRQINGVYRVKDPKLRERYGRLRAIIAQFAGFAAVHIPREENKRADRLANEAIDAAVKGR